MKFKYIALLLTCFTLFSCGKDEKENRDLTRGELTSFEILAEDNPNIIKQDIVAQTIEDKMFFRIPKGGNGKTLTATIRVNQDDEVIVNDEEIKGNKVAFDASMPLLLIVTNKKSNISRSYEVKIGKILETTINHIGTFEVPSKLERDFRMKVNPKDGLPYIAITKAADGGKVVSVLKFKDGNAEYVGMENVSDIGRVNAEDLFIDENGKLYLLISGEETRNYVGMKVFDGSNWTYLGPKTCSKQLLTSFGSPSIGLLNGNVPCFISTGGDRKDKVGYRNAVVYSYKGDQWTSSNLNGLPEYGSNPADKNAGMFYKGIPVQTKDGLYLITCSNKYGNYIFKATGTEFQKVVDNFLPNGEQYCVAANLGGFADKNGNVFVLTNLVSNGQCQLFKLNEKNNSLEAYSNPIECNFGSRGTPDVVLSVNSNPKSGQIVAVKTIKDSNLPSFAVLDENHQWTEFKQFYDVPVNNNIEISFAPDGTGYVIYTTKDNKIECFKIELEKDNE